MTKSSESQFIYYFNRNYANYLPNKNSSRKNITIKARDRLAKFFRVTHFQKFTKNKILHCFAVWQKQKDVSEHNGHRVLLYEVKWSLPSIYPQSRDKVRRAKLRSTSLVN